MNKETVQKRMQELKTKQQQLAGQATELKAQHDQLVQQIQLLEGAIADCMFWAAEAEKAEPQQMKIVDPTN